MLPAVLLGGALALGQSSPPSADIPPPASQVEVASQPAAQPPAQAPIVTIEVLPAPPQPDPPPSKTAATPPDRWALMRTLQGTWYGAVLDDHRVGISGWSEAAFTASSNRNDQLPLGFNYRANEFHLQQNWLRVERAVDPNASTPTWGFRSDTILPGIDYRFTIARGLFDRQLTANNGMPNRYGIDPVQFYAELCLPDVGRGLAVKVGRHFCQYGVESIDTTQNALMSHAYTFIYNPFTHTGVIATLKLSDAWSVQSGLVTGTDIFFDTPMSPTYMGSVKWAPPDGRDSVLFSVIIGKGRFDVAESFSNPQVFDLVWTHRFGDRLTYTVDALYSFQHGFPGGGASGFANNWGVVQYLTYQFAPKWSGTVRLEFFGDPQGQRTGTRGLYTAATMGVTYKPTPWLWFRPELRYDHCDGCPFEGRPALFTAAFSCLVRW